MTSCPRCGGQLELRSGGLIRDRHGIFVPASALRHQSNDRVAGELRASLGAGVATELPCPSCRAPLAKIELRGPPTLRLDGCAECGGFWFDDGELAALRRAMLSRGHEKPRAVGGYGGVATAKNAATSPVIEGIYSVITGLGGFL